MSSVQKSFHSINSSTLGVRLLRHTVASERRVFMLYFWPMIYAKLLHIIAVGRFVHARGHHVFQ